MAAPERLTESEIEAGLTEVPGWHREGETITGTWTFSDFAAAFAFMTEVAIHAEKLFHHPEWSNVYNRVSITLTTHDSGGLTASDIELATIVSSIASRVGAEPLTDNPQAG